MSQESILTLYSFRYLKWASALVALCVLAFVLHEPALGVAGNTWLGYGLGTLGALLIVWLMVYGMRKRAYSSGMGTVRGWLSAHVYLGIALLIVVTLHSGLQFGWNIHSAAYLFTVLVVGSGLWGVVLYLRQPELMSKTLNGKTVQQMGDALREMDEQSAKLAAGLGAEIQALVTASAQGLVFANGWQQLSGAHPTCATQAAVSKLETLQHSDSKSLRDLSTLQFRRLQQLNRLREYLCQKRWTEIWLLGHVPLAFALLATLIAHVTSVFFYW
jgi:hypothetical protein